jgi:hypothetical protein
MNLLTLVYLLTLLALVLSQTIKLPINVDSGYTCTTNGCTGGTSLSSYKISAASDSWAYNFFGYNLTAIPTKSYVSKAWLIFAAPQPIIADYDSSNYNTYVDVTMLPLGKKVPTSTTMKAADLGALTYQTKSQIVFNTAGSGLALDVTDYMNKLIANGDKQLAVNLADVKGSITVQSKAFNPDSSYIMVTLGAAPTIAPVVTSPRSDATHVASIVGIAAALIIALVL